MIDNIVPLIVCVNMSDYLRISIEKNRKFFSEYYILTCQEDIETIELCEKYSAKTLKYDKFFINENNCKFNKSGGIKYAQDILHKKYNDKWILLLDVDIVFTEETINNINDKNLNKEFLYGIDRYDVWTMEELENRFKKRKYNYNFAGYFQLYYNKEIYYPNFSKDASECDLTFMKKFKKKEIIDSCVFI